MRKLLSVLLLLVGSCAVADLNPQQARERELYQQFPVSLEAPLYMKFEDLFMSWHVIAPNGHKNLSNRGFQVLAKAVLDEPAEYLKDAREGQKAFEKAADADANGESDDVVYSLLLDAHATAPARRQKRYEKIYAKLEPKDVLYLEANIFLERRFIRNLLDPNQRLITETMMLEFPENRANYVAGMSAKINSNRGKDFEYVPSKVERQGNTQSVQRRRVRYKQ